MGEFSRELLQTAHLFSRAAAEQAGIISGDNPVEYNPKDPFRLWVIQVVIILGITQILVLILGRIRQPRVIAEVMGGIILGPTAMGRIPNFTATIFPDNGVTMLNLTSTIGLILFLFLVGLEIDVSVVKRKMAASVAISISGLVFPLGMGAAIGVGLYNQFVDSSVNEGYFLLFVAVAVGITAFPVLCRILSEEKLLDTTVGTVSLAAGVGNDVVGWILLALAVTLVNASSGLTALWVLLAATGFTIFLLYPVRWAYVQLARRSGSLEQGSPTTLTMTVTLLLVFISAFFTDVIGIHPIFGGFLVGLIIPHENNFAISLVERLEDLVAIILLPIYFTLSGLNTNLGSLDDGIAWGYTILLVVVAFSSKFFACALVAYFFKFNWREACAIGSLMSCKGLVELIVLNVGLSAHILDTRTFSMFVVHALIVTFMTTPLVNLFYPPRFRHHHDTLTKSIHPGPEENHSHSLTFDGGFKSKVSVILDRIDQLPAAMQLSRLISAGCPSIPASLPVISDERSDTKGHTDSDDRELSTPDPRPMQVNALRLIELTSRASAVLKSQEADSLIHNDSLLSIFRTFGALNSLHISARLSVVHQNEFSDVVARHASESGSELVLLPWARGAVSAYESDVQLSTRNPFDGIFSKSSLHIQDQTSSVVYSEFIRGVFLKSPSDVALFVDRGLSSEIGQAGHHIFLPFIGGPDDRLALTFLVQLCRSSSVTATVVRITKVDSLSPISTMEEAKIIVHNQMTLAGADTVYGNQTTQIRLASSAADDLIWEKYIAPTQEARDSDLPLALTRISFNSQATSKPLHVITDLVQAIVERNNGKTPIVFLGRSRRMAVESHEGELREIMNEAGGQFSTSVSRTLGEVGAALVAKGIQTSLLVMQAATPNSSQV
ncbi:hypothetical protein Agabi119p4_4226 [Agaricus bisporus var. burnettii]|uniref:Cation/H+ exchanger transmembrane domain-containing protein n=1 Tax=Agaricus bisporus var. burnettii TaxID=192524 RepID=A0A8H7KH71_AGABI|nr:hypothetical protein Agabi119p4_4226 [Agaricus bisporus var. burnettii]